ncbi:hypothetical protein D3C76_1032300 [compost metagenome]
MARRDALINADHDIRSNAVVDQRSVGRIDANQQRPLGLVIQLAQFFEVLLKAGSGGNDKRLPSIEGAKQLGDVVIRLHEIESGLQALDDLRRLGVEFPVTEGQMDFTDQSVANFCIEIIGQHQLGGQCEKRQLDFRQIACIEQFDPRVGKP